MRLELYYYTQCPFCMRVLRKIDELGLEAKISFKNTLEVPANREFHIQKTGRTTVPCLYIEGEPLFESSDICQWLEENQSKI